MKKKLLKAIVPYVFLIIICCQVNAQDLSIMFQTTTTTTTTTTTNLPISNILMNSNKVFASYNIKNTFFTGFN